MTILPSLINNFLIPCSNLSLDQIRKLTAYPTWNYITEIVIKTRAYEQALTATSVFIQIVEKNKDDLASDEFEKMMSRLCIFILDMLDRLDYWEEYLNVWNQLRENTSFSMTYNPSVLDHSKQRISPYIIKKDQNFLYVHFLYFKSHRKDIIERKLKRKQQGKKLGNQFHTSQADLSMDEKRERFNWMMNLIKNYSH